MTFSFFIYILLSIIQVIIPIFFILFVWHFHLTEKAPCVFMPKEVVPEIIKALNLNKESNFYDLGSGDGRIIFALHDKTPEAKFFGIDISPWNIFWANIKKKKTKNNENISFLKQDIMKTDLKNATHIFTYLFPKFMARVLPKLEKELKPGTILVSCDFFFPNKKPIKIIDLKREGGVIAKHLYVYKF